MITALTIFLIFVFLLLYGNIKNGNGQNTITEPNEKISIIIAAKNEEKNIPSLISALSKQNYPAGNYEVIIVDDESTDETFNTAENYSLNLNNYKIIKAVEKKHKGKRGALQIGIENAKYPNILITDADCQPEKNWINEFSVKFSRGYDFIFGVAPYKQTGSFINKIARFENLRTHILTFGFAKLGLPYSAAARSFGFKKESFIKIKGYVNTTETLSGDDDLLLREAVKHNLKITAITEPQAFVFSETKETFTGYLKQKFRHTSTSNYYSLKIKIILALWHLLNLLFLISPLLMLIDTSFGIFFIVKIIIDIITVKLLMKKYGYRFGIIEIIYLQIIYELLLVMNYLKATFGKEEW